MTNTPATLVELLRARVREQPERRVFTFLADGEREGSHLTYAELDRRARAIAAVLQRERARGERVLLVYPSGPEYIAAFFGCLYAGAAAVPVYPPRMNRTLPRLEAIARDAQARVALTVAATLSKVKKFAGDVSGLDAMRWLATDAIDGDLAAGWREPDVDGRTLALLQYTSGSTAAPKGVCVTHGNLLHNEQRIQDAFHQDARSIVVGWLPLYHDMGLIGNVLQPVYAGASCVLMSPADFLQKPLRWLQAISSYGATTSGGPDFAYDLCVRKITADQRATLDLSRWRVAFNGSEPVRPATLERFAATFGPCGFDAGAFHPCYGLAEATLMAAGAKQDAAPVVLIVDAGALAEHRAVPASAAGVPTRALVSCGRTPSADRIAIVHPESRTPCGPGEVGEIWMSGPSVAHGYWNRPDETEATFQARLADSMDGPFLRTGDLGFVRDGELFVTGRLKDLVIIRGRNHYPHDIELTVGRCHAALRAHAAAAFAVDAEAGERLVIVQEVEPRAGALDVDGIAAAIRRAVAEDHDVHVHAIVLTRMGSVPKTSSGKIQRRACRDRFLSGDLDVIAAIVGSEPSSEPDEPAAQVDLAALSAAERRPAVARWIADRVARLTKTPRPEVAAEPLVASGLDSLGAMQLLHDIDAAFGVDLRASDLLDGRTAADLAALVTESLAGLAAVGARSSARDPFVQPAPDRRETPLSFDQERLWVLDQLDPESDAYTIGLAARCEGPLRVAILEQAIAEIVRRHEILRTRVATRLGVPVQVVAPPRPVPLRVVDISAVAADRRADALDDIVKTDRAHRFDLTRGPLIRTALVRESARSHVLVVSSHHLVSDAWSFGVFIRELAAAFRAFAAGTPSPLPELSLQFGDYAVWQRRRLQAGAWDADLAYWKTRLADPPAALPLPMDRPRRHPHRAAPARYSFELPPATCAALQALARAEGTTLFMTLLAAWNVLLHRITGRHDLVVGVPTVNRRKETEDLLGSFACPLVLRAHLSGNPSLREILAHVRRACLEASAHGDVPFARVAAALPERGRARHPLFQVLFSFVNAPPRVAIDPPGLTLSPAEIEVGTSDLDLFMLVVQDDTRLRGSLGYDAALFDVETIGPLVASYGGILEQYARALDTRLDEVALQPALDARIGPRPTRAADTIAIAATFTAEPIAGPLAFWMEEIDGLEAPTRIVFAPYGQVFQSLLDPQGVFAANARGVNVLLVRLEDWDADAAPGAPSIPAIERNARDLVEAVRAAASRGGAPLLVCLCPASPARAPDTHLADVEARLADRLAAITGVQVVTSDDLRLTCPTASYSDAVADRLGRVPYTPVFYAALATMVARRTFGLRQAPHKVIVLDCDQTLWSGYAGEDGVERITVDATRQALQDFMIAQRAAGRLLCICSRNDEADVLRVFDGHSDMRLARGHIAAWRVNWGRKSENIRSLAAELRLGLDSFVFLDDDPVECEEVRRGCPEVLTLQLPRDTRDVARFLASVWAFDRTRVTGEDARRSAFYAQDAEREQVRQSATTMDEFLAGLGLEVRISAMRPDQLARVAQLTERTNQFNVTAARRDEAVIRERLARGGECFVAEVSDRFGDYGTVGAAIVTPRPDAAALDVDTFVLSCRALGRGVEHRMLAHLGELALARGLGRVDARYVPTPRNRLARAFLEAVGPDVQEPCGQDTWFRLPAARAAAARSRSAAAPAGGAASAGEPSPSNVAPAAPGRSRAARAIERGIALADPARLHDAWRARVRVRSDREQPFVAARTPTEHTVAALWAEIVGLDRVGIHDEFLATGGHSLHAVQLVSRLRESFGVEIPLNALLAGAPTVATLAGLIVEHQLAQEDAAAVAAMTRAVSELSDEDVLRLLSEESGYAPDRGLVEPMP